MLPDPMHGYVKSNLAWINGTSHHAKTALHFNLTLENKSGSNPWDLILRRP